MFADLVTVSNDRDAGTSPKSSQRLPAAERRAAGGQPTHSVSDLVNSLENAVGDGAAQGDPPEPDGDAAVWQVATAGADVAIAITSDLAASDADSTEAGQSATSAAPATVPAATLAPVPIAPVNPLGAQGATAPSTAQTSSETAARASTAAATADLTADPATAPPAGALAAEDSVARAAGAQSKPANARNSDLEKAPGQPHDVASARRAVPQISELHDLRFDLPPAAAGPPNGHAPAAAMAGIAEAAGPPAAETARAAVVPMTGLAVEIAARALEGKRRFEIRLDPPELGRIDVRLDIGRDGQVTSRLVVERAETLDLLRRDSLILERALQSAGLRTDDAGLQFSLRDHPSNRWTGSEVVPRSNLLIVPDEDVAVREAVRRGYGVLRGMGRGVDIRV